MRDLIGDATPELGHLPEYEVSRGPSVEAQIFGRESVDQDRRPALMLGTTLRESVVLWQALRHCANRGILPPGR